MMVDPLRQYPAMGSNEPITVRAAQQEDARAVAVFQTAVWREVYAGLVPQDYLDRVGVDDRLHRWSGRFVTGSRRVVVAETDGEVVGVVSWSPSDRDGLPPVELKSLYVGAAHRGAGLATRLFRAAVANEPAYLWVFVENPRAHAFYARHGFTPDGERAVDPGTGVLEQRMVRR